MTGTATTPEFAATVPVLGPEHAVVWPKRTRRTLANGLEVVLAESRNVPKLTGVLYFRSGNAATALDAPGLAEFTAAVVRTGTAKRSSRQIEDDLRRMGADLGTGAGADNSTISFSGLSEFAGELLGLVAELANAASFPADEFERERRQMLEGLRIERTTPSFLASERFRKVLFGSHPYAVVSPTERQVEKYTLNQLAEFYRAHYRPGNALLLIVGDFVPEALMAEIERVFGDWLPGEIAALPDPPLPEARYRRVYLVHRPESGQAQIVVGNRGITRKHPDWLRLSLANSLFGGAFNSRLVMNIREAKGYTYSPRSSAHALRHHGYFSVHAAVRNEVVAATLTEIFYEMDRMRALPVGEEELADTRNYMTGVYSLGLATQEGLAGQLSAIYLERLPEDYLETYRARIRALTPADVLAAARSYFDSPNAQIVVVGDRQQIEEQASLFGPVECYDTQGAPIAAA